MDISNQTFDEFQNTVINADDSKILCIAGAGTGKTYTMLHRIYRLIDEGVSPKNMLVLTFTNAAAVEMKTRYFKDRSTKVSPLFKTFHGFCYKLISRDSEVQAKLEYLDTPQIITDSELDHIKQKIEDRLNLKFRENLKYISPKLQQEQHILSVALNREIRKLNVITFDLLSQYVCNLFKEKDRTVQKYLNQYEYIFCDEFQDTDPTQWRFIDSFGESSKLFLIGDLRQAIYSFRGADSSLMKSLISDSSWAKYSLRNNRRSTKQICHVANTVFPKRMNYEDLISEVSGEKICNVRADSIDDFSEECWNYLINYLKTHSSSSAILCRTNAEVKSVRGELKRRNIPFKTSTKSKESIKTDLCKMLLSAIDDETREQFLISKLNKSEYFMYLRAVSTSSKFTTSDILEEFYNNEKIQELNVQINLIHENMSKLLETRDLSKFQVFLFNWFNELNLSISLDTIQSTIIDIDSLDSFESIVKIVIEFLDNVEDSELEETLICPYVGTIHSVKGLEFDTVILLDVDSKQFRLTSEESLNLYYVGITRAKQSLCIHKCKSF